MLLLAYERGAIAENGALDATPIAVSYEIEPCDTSKAAALIGTQTRNQSEQRARRDVSEIMRGLLQPKGRICLTIRPPISLTENHHLARSRDRADIIAALAQKVDDEIRQGYARWPTNYAAYDFLHRTTAHAERYSIEEGEAFLAYVHHAAEEIVANHEDAVAALLSLYARSVVSP